MSIRHEHTGWPSSLFVRLAGICNRRAVPIIVVAVLAGCVSTVYTIQHLGFTTDRNVVLDTAAPYHQRYLALQREFGVDQEMIVVARGQDPANNRRAVNALEKTLRADKVHYGLVLDRINLDFVRHRLLLYLPLPLLEKVEEHIHTYAPLLRRLLRRPGLVPLFNTLDDELHAAVQKAVTVALRGHHPVADRHQMKLLSDGLPVLTGLVNDMNDALAPGFHYQSPWRKLVPPLPNLYDLPTLENVPHAFYFSYGHGSIYLLIVIPHLDKHLRDPVGDAVARLETAMDTIGRRFPDVTLGLTGKPVFENDELKVATQGSESATVVSFIGVMLLFLLTFRHLARPLLAMACLALALTWTMGYTTLIIGRLNILTVNAMPMLVGLGIDFGIQVVCRYGEERARGNDALEAMTRTMAGTGSSIAVAGLTTSASFYAAWFTEFRGFRELALLSGTGLLFCLVSMMVVYPAMLLLAERRGTSVTATPFAGMARAEKPLLEYPWIPVIFAALLTTVALAASSHLQFDANPLHVQAPHTPSLDWEKRVERAGGHSWLYAALVAKNLHEARVLERRLQRLSQVAQVTSATMLVPPDQGRKLPVLAKIQDLVNQLPPLPPATDHTAARPPETVIRPRDLARVLEDLRKLFLIVYPQAETLGGRQLSREVVAFVFSLDTFLGNLHASPQGAVSRQLEAYQREVFDDLADKMSLLGGRLPPRRIRLAEIPPEIRGYLVSPKTGRLLIRVFPSEDVWNPGPMRRFLGAVQKAYGRPITGTAVEVYREVQELRRSCQRAELYAMCAIVIVLLLHLRSVPRTLLALLPLMLGLAWSGGLLVAIGQSMNPINYMALPLVLGVGVTNGVYVVRRFQEEGRPTLFAVSTGRAIILSNLTAMIGFGSLLVARHVGMRSLGLTMAVGIGACAIAALFVLAPLIEILRRHDDARFL